MATIESKKAEIHAPAESVYQFLMNMNNIEKLLPIGRYSDWQGDVTSCSFKLNKTYLVRLSYQSSTPFTSIQYESGPGLPFNFNLTAKLQEANSITTGQLICEAQINPFLEMMVKGPLSNLFDHMSAELVKQFPAS